MPIFIAEFVKLSSIQALLLFIGHNFSPKIEAEHPLHVCCEMLAISMYPHMLIAIFDDSYHRENSSKIQGQGIYRGVSLFLLPIILFQISMMRT